MRLQFAAGEAHRGRVQGTEGRQNAWSWVGAGAQEETAPKDTRARLLLSHSDKQPPMNRAPFCLGQWHPQAKKGV